MRRGSDDVVGTVKMSYSLLGVNLGAAIVDNGGNIVGTIGSPINAMLGPLADNGGFELPDGSHILTHALLPGSPAINAGDLNAVAGQEGVPLFDQRGESFGRIVGGRIDIGAFEYQTPTDLNLLVDTLSDESDGDYSRGDLSLREAIELANASKYAGVVDTIRFDPALTAAGPASILLAHGELKITDSLTIDGPGADLLTIDASGNDATPGANNGDGSRVFDADDGDGVASIDVALSGLRLTGGDVASRGGAILSRENLALSASVIEGNSANNSDELVSTFGGGIDHGVGTLAIVDSMIGSNSAGFGGGIHLEDGQLTVTGSQIVGNTALSGAGLHVSGGDASIRRSAIAGNLAPGIFALGGGIYTSGNLSVAETTISGNSAGFGAGVFSRTHGAQSTTISNSTVSGNLASERGGGVRNAEGLTTIEYSTITGNSAPAGEGSGVASRGYATARTVLRSTIVAGNTNSDVDFVTGVMNTFESAGYNVIGTGNAVAVFDAARDATGVADPLLGPLADNGGFELPDGSHILTHALLAGSPAINAGDLNAVAGAGGVPEFDERGEPFGRIVGGRIDIGAFEYQTPTDLNLLVDTLADESYGDYSRGDLSLREALELANANPGTDTVSFDGSLANDVVRLTLGQLLVTDAVVIDGAALGITITADARGDDVLVPGTHITDVAATLASKAAESDGIDNDDDGLVDGADTDGENLLDDNSRVLMITGADSATTIHGLTFTGGRTTLNGGTGGGIQCAAPLALTDCNVSGNSTIGAASLGGGIFSRGAVTLTRSTVSGNSTTGEQAQGGGIFGSVAVTLTQSTVSGNSTSGYIAGGGGISSIRDITLSNSTVAGNSTAGRRAYGGGIFGLGAITVTQSTVSGNATKGDLAPGGGICTSRDVTLSSSTVAGNSTAGRQSYGGGICSSAMTLTRSTVIGNFTTGSRARGGGIYGQGAMILTQSTVSGNWTAGSGALGGGVYAFRTVTLTGSTVSSNFTTGDFSNGGGISGQVTLTQSTVSGNYTTGNDGRGGGISGSGAILVQSTVSGNSTAGSSAAGGGIFVFQDVAVHQQHRRRQCCCQRFIRSDSSEWQCDPTRRQRLKATHAATVT